MYTQRRGAFHSPERSSVLLKRWMWPVMLMLVAYVVVCTLMDPLHIGEPLDQFWDDDSSQWM
jgi:hypothetical protein